MDIAPRSVSYALDQHDWLGSAHGTDSTETITLDLSLFDKATHYPDGFIRSGTPLGKVTAGGLYGPYAGGASNGQDVLAGFLYGGVEIPTGSPAPTRLGAALFVHGKVREARLPIAVDANGKTDVAGRIRFI